MQRTGPWLAALLSLCSSLSPGTQRCPSAMAPSRWQKPQVSGTGSTTQIRTNCPWQESSCPAPECPQHPKTAGDWGQHQGNTRYQHKGKMPFYDYVYNQSISSLVFMGQPFPCGSSPISCGSLWILTKVPCFHLDPRSGRCCCRPSAWARARWNSHLSAEAQQNHQ